MKKRANKKAHKKTFGGQTEGKQRATNKNDKNDKNEKEEKNAVGNITKCYEENIGMITPAVTEELFSYLDDMEDELIIKAIKIASIRNKRSMIYVKGILNDWIRKGYKVIADIQEEQQKDNNHKEETEEEKKQRKLRELEEAMKNDRW